MLREVGQLAFANNAKLTQLVLPNSVEFVDGLVANNNTVMTFTEYENGKYIGTAENPYLVFCGAISDAETLTIHADTKFISAYLANSCPSLVSIELPEGVIAIGAEAFSWLEHLESVKMPSTLTYIGNRAFQYCSALKSIEIPKGVTLLDEWTFAYCSELTTVTFAKDSELEQIEILAFYQCTKLTHIVLPESLRLVGGTGGGNSFDGCSQLSVVVISPETFVESQTFENCAALNTVYFRGTAEEWETWKSTYAVENGNGYLLNLATVYFYSDIEPEDANGCYWHYGDNGEILLW